MDNEIGMVGLGVMGRNLVLNMADHGFAVAGYDKDTKQVELLKTEANGHKIAAMTGVKEFIDAMAKPRAVMMLVPAGKPVDAVIHDLLPFLEPGDIIIDGGNSYFKDTNLRARALAEKGIQFLGVGISGGEYGARYGPSIMPGGPREAYERIRPIFEAVAAKVNTGRPGSEGEPCVAYLGPGSAGHYVKMVHNGIEYGMLRLISESYDLFKRGLGYYEDELSQIYDRWNQGKLNSYLIEITSRIFLQKDERTGQPLVELILDEARQKGTGRWTSEDGMDLSVPLMTIDVSVAMRNLSTLKQERELASQVLTGPDPAYKGDRDTFVRQLESAMYMAMIITYAQGLALHHKGSETYHYDLSLETVARIWRGGCIIRAALLDLIRAAYHDDPSLSNLLVDTRISQELVQRQGDLRAVVRTATDLGISIPAFMTALAYYDGYRSAWMPANLIQAQRDYFGAHTYERVDDKGVFHTEWDEGSGMGSSAAKLGGG